MVNMDNLVGSKIHKLHNAVSRRIENYAASVWDIPVSGPNLFILKYLMENKDKDIFQRDLEKVLSVTKSTCSKVISVMESKNLVVRGSVDDARFNKITITTKGEDMVERFDKFIYDFDKFITQGLSEDQLDTFFVCLDTIEKNLKK